MADELPCMKCAAPLRPRPGGFECPQCGEIYYRYVPASQRKPDMAPTAEAPALTGDTPPTDFDERSVDHVLGVLKQEMMIAGLSGGLVSVTPLHAYGTGPGGVEYLRGKQYVFEIVPRGVKDAEGGGGKTTRTAEM